MTAPGEHPISWRTTGWKRMEPACAALLGPPSRWRQMQERLRTIVEHRIPLRRTAQLLDAVHRGGAHRLFTKTGQFLLATGSLIGLGLFVYLSGSNEASGAQISLSVILPVAILAIVWHELGHALTAKAFGRDVRLGVGWYWFAPLLYVDTTDTWLAGKWPRIAVSIAGFRIGHGAVGSLEYSGVSVGSRGIV